MFALIAPLSYWVLVLLWGLVLVLYLRIRRRVLPRSAVALLLVILSLDALRTLIESTYFGFYFNSLAGLLPARIHQVLGQPELLILPKFLNIVVALAVLTLLIRRWLPQEIVERKAQQELLTRSQDYNRLLFEQSPVGLLLCRMDGSFVDANPAFAQIIGYSVAETLALSYWDITPESYAAEEERQLESLAQTGRYGPYEKEYRHKAGHLVPVQLEGLILEREGERFIWSSVQDISARKRDEEARIEVEQQFQNLIKVSPLPLCLVNRQGELTYLNDRFVKLFGWDLHDAPTLSAWRERAYPDPVYRDWVVQTWEAAVARAVAAHSDVKPEEFCITCKDGTVRTVEVTGIFVGDNFLITMNDLTERRQAEAALRRSEEQFRTLVTLAPLPISFVNQGGELRFINDRFIQVLGWTLEDVPTLEAWWQKAYPDPAYRAWVLETWNAALLEAAATGRDIRPVEYNVTCKNGSVRVMEISGCTIGDDFIAILIDLTDRRRAQRALRESEERYRQLYTAMVQPMALHEIICDESGKPVNYRYLDVNPAFEELLGLTRQQIIGRTVLDLLPDLEEFWIDTYGQVALTGVATHFTQYAASLGRHFDVVAYSPRPGEFAIISTDITERTEMLLAQQRLEKQMLETQKLESLGMLAGGIAHDFNNILMAVLGNADLAKVRLAAESPAMVHLEQIESAAMKAADLANQMLAYSGKGKFVVEPLHLGRVVEEMTHMCEVSISKKAVLRFQLAENLPSVEADITQLRQVILNLVINASEAIGQRSGVISINTGSMYCDRAYLQDLWLDENLPAGLYVFLEVVDTGCGMDRETLGRIFDPFFTTKFTGRGLGMAAVLGIVRGHKGAIKVYSEPGKGSTFKVLLPASERPAELYDLPENDQDWRGEGLVLLVDDEETVRTIGSTLLEELGFSVETRADGREAVEFIREKRDRVRFVVMDLTMPHMDGEEAFREMRRIDPGIKVIMTSGYNEQEVSQRFVGKGLAGFLQKPYSLSALRAAVKVISEATGS